MIEVRMAIRAINIANINRNMREAAQDQAQYDVENATTVTETDPENIYNEIPAQNTSRAPSGDRTLPSSNNNPAFVNDGENEIHHHSVLPGMETPTIASIDTPPVNQTNENRTTRRSRDLSCCEFYKKHYIGHLATGIIAAFLFFVIGIVLILYEDSVPVYIGVTILMVGFLPLFLGIQRWRFHRSYMAERRQIQRRREAIRSLHRQGAESNARYPDLPPSYDNLAFQDGEFKVEVDKDILPTYDDEMRQIRSLPEDGVEQISQVPINPIDEAADASSSQDAQSQSTSLHVVSVNDDALPSYADVSN